MEKNTLIAQAKEAQKLSYSPYSHFAVGAAIALKDGNVVLGANIENASYGLSMCAERNAVYQAYLKGYKKEDIIALALVANSDKLVTPCGACRQVLCELFPSDAPIYIETSNGESLETTIKELLPYSFDKENLE